MNDLKNKGWSVVQDYNNFFVYRYGTKATEFPFEDEDKAWKWLRTFLQTL
jgi:hypothetical protein